MKTMYACYEEQLLTTRPCTLDPMNGLVVRVSWHADLVLSITTCIGCAFSSLSGDAYSSVHSLQAA